MQNRFFDRLLDLHVDDVSQPGGDEDPNELVPVKERNSPNLRFDGVVKWNPKQRDEGKKQERVPR
jgi:hypothetical protein